MPLLDLVKSKTKDDSGRLTDLDDYLPAIDAALEKYSGHRPKELVADLAGADSRDLDLPASYVDGFSTITAVEYPIGEVEPSLVDADDRRLYRDPAGIKLRLFDIEVPVGESVRLTYTAPRFEADIVPGDGDAVACLAASICLRTLAAIYGQTSDPTIQADVVNYRSKADEFRRLADALEERYRTHLGIDKNGSAPAAMTLASPSRRHRGRLTH